MTYQTSRYQSADDRCRRLEDELYETRRAVLKLLPEEVRKVAEGFHACKTRGDAHAWETRLLEYIINSAKLLGPDEGSHLMPRAYCPLCREGSSGPYDRGFALPEGLRRHLTGWGSARQCSVLSPIVAGARDYLEPHFREVESANDEARTRLLAERRLVETLYRVSPEGEPKLFDEDLSYDGPARDQAMLPWAEARLIACGCVQEENGRVRSFTKVVDGFIAYGDPRPAGKLKVTLFQEPSTTPKRKSGRTKQVMVQSFYLPDAWQHDLPTKLHRRLTRAVESVTAHRPAR